VQVQENNVNVSIIKPWSNYTMIIKIMDDLVIRVFNAKNVPCDICSREFYYVGGYPVVSLDASVRYGMYAN
jgi:hypothetical protein